MATAVPSGNCRRSVCAEAMRCIRFGEGGELAERAIADDILSLKFRPVNDALCALRSAHGPAAVAEAIAMMAADSAIVPNSDFLEA